MRLLLSAMTALAIAACAEEGARAVRVAATVETEPAPSTEDAADDPAIWVRAGDPARSLVLGTDKQTGLYVYDLLGNLVQSLPVGPLNNVDIRRNIAGAPFDVAAASNDGRNVVSLFSIDRRSGAVAPLADFPTGKDEPYGLCLASMGGALSIIVTYKDGAVQFFSVQPGDLQSGVAGAVPARLERTLAFSSQLEGCVADEENARFFVGEEQKGVWAIDLDDPDAAPQLLDAVGGVSGLAADVEGVTIWRGADGAGFLVVSAQGADRFIVYDRQPPFAVRGAFSIASHLSGGELIDGVTGTDGIDAAAASLGDGFPRGLLAVQDDVNSDPAANQNFKYVDWRKIEKALDLPIVPFEQAD
ncbi:MAG: phytase [Pseudomonadota bacterium]